MYVKIIYFYINFLKNQPVVTFGRVKKIKLHRSNIDTKLCFFYKKIECIAPRLQLTSASA